MWPEQTVKPAHYISSQCAVMVPLFTYVSLVKQFSFYVVKVTIILMSKVFGSSLQDVNVKHYSETKSYYPF